MSLATSTRQRTRIRLVGVEKVFESDEWNAQSFEPKTLLWKDKQELQCFSPFLPSTASNQNFFTFTQSCKQNFRTICNKSPPGNIKIIIFPPHFASPKWAKTQLSMLITSTKTLGFRSLVYLLSRSFHLRLFDPNNKNFLHLFTDPINQHLVLPSLFRSTAINHGHQKARMSKFFVYFPSATGRSVC